MAPVLPSRKPMLQRSNHFFGEFRSLTFVHPTIENELLWRKALKALSLTEINFVLDRPLNFSAGSPRIVVRAPGE